MNIPDQIINCIRCTNSATIEVTGMRKGTKEWIPMNPSRPPGWLATSTDSSDMNRGICPSCAPAWHRVQEAFMATPTEAKDGIELRPINKPAKKFENMLTTHVSAPVDTNIPMPAIEAAPINSIPMYEVPVRQPEPLWTPDSSSASVRHATRTIRSPGGAASISETRPSLAAAAPSRVAGMSPMSMAPERTNPITHVPIPTAGAKAIPRMAAINSTVQSIPMRGITVQRPEPIQQLRCAAAPVSQRNSIIAQNVSQAPIQPIAAAVLPARPEPIVSAIHLNDTASSLAPVSFSANVGGGIVTTSTPRPVQTVQGGGAAVVTDMRPIETDR